MNTIRIFLLLLAVSLTGCRSSHVNLQPGGAYYPTVTNSAGTVTALSQPEQALFVADAAYKLAYDTVFAVFKFERDNRAALLNTAPQIKPGLDKLRLKFVSIDKRWAIARKAYKANPTPAGLNTIQSILFEIHRLIPVVQTEIVPAYDVLTTHN